MKKWLLGLVCLLAPVLAHGQGSQFTAGPFSKGGFLYLCPVPSGGTPCPSPVAIFADAALSVSVSNPIQMSAGNTVSFYAAGGQYTLQYPATGFSQVVGGGSSSSSPSPSSALFYASNVACGGATNCVQWVDDDVTNNCGAATTAWMALINAYNGPGYVQVLINGSGPGKAYKFSSCNLAFTIQSGSFTFPGVHIQLSATIDCAQSTANCIQIGLSTLTNYSTGGKTVNGTIDGGGTIVGCVSVTAACIEFEPFQGHAVVKNIHFANTGAGNATLGNCTNFSVQFDSPTAEPELADTMGYWTTAGVCVSNNTDLTGGNNTIRMTNNHWGVSGACGSVGHVDSSSHSDISHNSLFGFGMSFRLTMLSSNEGGWMIANNSLDSNSCTAQGVQAMIHFGGPSSNVGIGPATILDNETCCSSHTTNLLTVAGDCGGCFLKGVNIIGNMQAFTPAGTLFPAATQCQNMTIPCRIAGNTNYTTVGFQSGGGIGFAVDTQVIGGVDFFTQAANVGTTNLTTAVLPVNAHVTATCYVIITQAATTSSTMPSCTIGWTDVIAVGSPTKTITATSATNTVATFDQGSVTFMAKSGTQITWSTSGYASVGATPMQYTVITRLIQQQ